MKAKTLKEIINKVADDQEIELLFFVPSRQRNNDSMFSFYPARYIDPNEEIKVVDYGSNPHTAIRFWLT